MFEQTFKNIDDILHKDASLFFKILKYPDISGQWLCKGISDYQEENAEMIRHNREWEAQITILQSWDK